jgi:hypothetical protein
MKKFVKGMTAGLIATIALSVLLAMRAMVGVMPAFELPSMIARMMGIS